MMCSNRAIAQTFCNRQRGLTLIEVMVSLVVGLILTGGVIQIYVSSQESYRFQESLSRVQETGRFVLNTLARDLRETGFRGCGGRDLGNMKVTDLTGGGGGGGGKGKGKGGGGGTSSDELFSRLETSLQGYVHNGSWTPSLATDVADHDPEPTGDILRLRSLGFGPNTTVSDNQSNGSNLFVNDVSGFEQNQTVVATNCQEAVRFEIRNNAGGSGEGQFTVPGNPQFYDTYEPHSMHDDVSDRYYFVAENDETGKSALYRLSDDDGSPVEIAQDIERLAYSFGVDESNNGEVDAYRTGAQVETNNEWNEVVAIRVGVLVSGGEDNVTDDPQVVVFPPWGDPDSDTWTAPDRRLYQTFTTTVGLRNRLP